MGATCAGAKDEEKTRQEGCATAKAIIKPGPKGHQGREPCNVNVSTYSVSQTMLRTCADTICRRNWAAAQSQLGIQHATMHLGGLAHRGALQVQALFQKPCVFTLVPLRSRKSGGFYLQVGPPAGGGSLLFNLVAACGQV